MSPGNKGKGQQTPDRAKRRGGGDFGILKNSAARALQQSLPASIWASKLRSFYLLAIYNCVLLLRQPTASPTTSLKTLILHRAAGRIFLKHKCNRPLPLVFSYIELFPSSECLGSTPIFLPLLLQFSWDCLPSSLLHLANFHWSFRIQLPETLPDSHPQGLP